MLTINLTPPSFFPVPSRTLLVVRCLNLSPPLIPGRGFSICLIWQCPHSRCKHKASRVSNVVGSNTTCIPSPLLKWPPSLFGRTSLGIMTWKSFLERIFDSRSVLWSNVVFKLNQSIFCSGSHFYFETAFWKRFQSHPMFLCFWYFLLFFGYFKKVAKTISCACMILVKKTS